MVTHHAGRRRSLRRRVFVLPAASPRATSPRGFAPRDLAPRDLAPRNLAPRNLAPRDLAPRGFAGCDVQSRDLRCLPVSERAGRNGAMCPRPPKKQARQRFRRRGGPLTTHPDRRSRRRGLELGFAELEYVGKFGG